MITTLLLDILNFFWFGLIEFLWPDSIAGFSLNTITDALWHVFSLFMPLLRIINVIIPLEVIFAGALIFLTLYAAFFLFKVGRLVLGLVRPGVG